MLNEVKHLAPARFKACLSPGGIPFLDWGGHGPVLHFAHANGFPPATYGAFIGSLTDPYHCLAYEARPLWGTHDPRLFRHWRELASDMARFLDEMGLDSLIWVGHSLGAVTSLFCAADQPARFRALVLIDPVILPLHLSPLLVVTQRLGLASRLSLPSRTRRRRMEWPSQELVFRAYRSAPVFARWSDSFLWDYVLAVTEDTPDGAVHLRYPREWEARIFETVPPDAWLAMPRLRHMPTLVLRGEHSTTYRRDAMWLMRQFLPHAEFAEIEGADHFVPMTQPQRAADVILKFLGRL